MYAQEFTKGACIKRLELIYKAERHLSSDEFEYFHLCDTIECAEHSIDVDQIRTSGIEAGISNCLGLFDCIAHFGSFLLDI